jgi:two-component system sensor histidine kinase BaeS
VDLKTLVDEVANRYRFAAEAAGLELTVDDGGGMREAQVDGQLIGRAVGNLISNAIKYTPSGGRVSVSLGKSRDHALIQVRDSGTGIAPEELPLLFKRYSRTSSARGIEGSGLGLYIVRCIAEAHGGTATATSKQGEGSTFTLAVPL